MPDKADQVSAADDGSSGRRRPRETTDDWRFKGRVDLPYRFAVGRVKVGAVLKSIPTLR
jgi:hypothetical protein